MKIGFAMYDMMPCDDPNKCLQWLCYQAYQMVDRKAKHNNLLAMCKNGHGATTILAIPGAGDDRSTEAWKKKQAEIAAKVKLAQTAAAAAKAKAAGKGKGAPWKGKGKGGTDDDKGTGEGKGEFRYPKLYDVSGLYATCIYHMRGGTCEGGDHCPFIHYDYVLPKPQRKYVPPTKYPAGTDLTKVMNLKTMSCRHLLHGRCIEDKDFYFGHDCTEPTKVQAVTMVCIVSTSEDHAYFSIGKSDANNVRWALDTATLHDASGVNIKGRISEDDDLPNLGTAAGPYQPETDTEVNIQGLGNLLSDPQTS